MAYPGKFIDREPFTVTAGKATLRNLTTCDILQRYNFEELAATLAKKKINKQLTVGKTSLAPRTPIIHESDMGNILCPEWNKSRFVKFRENFLENLYFTKPALGQVLSLNLKPKNLDENIIYGKKYEDTGSAYELILPKKTPQEVDADYIKWHDKYVLSHKHYFPSEKISRGYDSKKFNPKQRFGIKNKVDYNGLGIKQIFNCFGEQLKIPIISSRHELFQKNHFSGVGKPKQSHHIPEDIHFGHKKRSDKYRVKELLENADPNEFEDALRISLSYVHKVRRRLFLRRDFYFHDFRTALEKQDLEQTGFLDWDQVFQTARRLFIYMDERKIEMTAKYLGYANDNGDTVDYYKLIGMLQLSNPIPSIRTKYPIWYSNDSTYQQLCNEAYVSQYCEKSMLRESNDVPKIKFIRKSNEETTVKNLIPPNVTPAHLGLNQKEFFLLRPKQEIRKIFGSFKLEDDVFDIIWGEALRQNTTLGERVSVDTFVYAMNIL